jgi:hypothetical protein
MARILADGTVTDIIAQDVKIWGWAPADPCAPDLQYDGAMSSAVVPGWSAAAPRPLIVEANQSIATDWFVSMARIHADGSVSDILADTVKVWGW